MDNPVPDGHGLALISELAQPGDEVHQRFLMPDPVSGAPGHLVQDRQIRVLDEKVSRSSEPLVETLPDKPRLRIIR